MRTFKFCFIDGMNVEFKGEDYTIVNGSVSVYNNEKTSAVVETIKEKKLVVMVAMSQLKFFSISDES